MEKLTVIQSAGPIKFREILKEVQFVEWSKAYVQYEQLRPLVARVGLIRKEKDEAKNYEVRKSSLADAEEALWLAVHQQVDKADAFYKSLVESLDQQYEVVVREMSKVKQLQEFLIKNDLYAPRQMVLAYGHLIVDGFYGPLTRYIHACVCVCMYMHVCMYVYTHIHTHTHTHTHTHLYI